MNDYDYDYDYDNEDVLFRYLLEMGAMQPEEQKLARQQATVDALRSRSMEPLQGQTVGRVYVGPSIAQGLAQLGTAYMANKGQNKFDDDFDRYNKEQKQRVEKLWPSNARSNSGDSDYHREVLRLRLGRYDA